jgi:hypothetical protein
MNMVNIYRVKADANWLPFEVKFDCDRSSEYAHQYPHVYRDDIREGHREWETNYFERMGELVGKPVELYIVAVDELGAFAQATAILNQHGDQD